MIGIVCLFSLEDSNEGVGETERGGRDDDDYDEDAVSMDGICLEAKEVVQYTSDESSSTDEEEEFRDDVDDADYGSGKGKGTWIHLSEFLFFANVQKDLMRRKEIKKFTYASVWFYFAASSRFIG